MIQPKRVCRYENIFISTITSINYNEISYIYKMPYKDHEKRKEKNKEYYEKNKEREKEKAKEYYEKNKETLIEKQKEYYDNNKEKIKEYKDEYYEKIQKKLLTLVQNVAKT